MKMRQFVKAVPQLILAPVVIMGITVLTLYLLGLAPDYIQGHKNGFKEYDSIEEAETDLGFSLAVPSYFPSYLSWPPATILAQREPETAVQTIYHSRQGNTETLLIYQIELNSEDLPVPIPWIETIQEEIPITIGEYNGYMITGTGTNAELLNGAYWKSDLFHFIVVTTRSERDLLTIVNSM